MAQIQINYVGVEAANELLRKAIRELELVEREMNALESGIDPDIQLRYSIASSLRNAHASAKAGEQKTRQLLDVVKTGVQKYKITESRIRRMIPDSDMMYKG